MMNSTMTKEKDSSIKKENKKEPDGSQKLKVRLMR